MHRVKRLELFGSAVGEAFDPARSDVDLLVEFDAWRVEGAFDRYFGFKEAVEKLFGRPVDLVMANAVANPFFLRAIERTRQILYAA